jgi:hypothetical protein
VLRVTRSQVLLYALVCSAGGYCVALHYTIAVFVLGCLASFLGFRMEKSFTSQDSPDR